MRKQLLSKVISQLRETVWMPRILGNYIGNIHKAIGSMYGVYNIYIYHKNQLNVGR